MPNLLNSSDNAYSSPVLVELPCTDRDKDLAMAYLELEAATRSHQTINYYDDYTYELLDELKDATLSRRYEYSLVHQLGLKRMVHGWGDLSALKEVKVPWTGEWSLK